MGLKQMVLSFAVAVMMLSGLKAQSDINQAKAIYIYNFLSHVMWQENQHEDRIVIGIIGESKVMNYLKSYTQNRKIGAKNIEIIKVGPDNQLLNCQVVFVSQERSKDMASINKILKGRSCLVIGDKNGMTKEGATINFIHEDYKLKFLLSEENASAHKLSVSKTLKALSL